MRRLPKEEIIEEVASVLLQQDEFQVKRQGDFTMRDARIKYIADHVARVLDNKWSMVIHADRRGDGMSGEWGVTEPDPAGLAKRPPGYNGGHHSSPGRL